MKKRATLVLILALLVIVISLVFINKLTGFAVSSKHYNITCVYNGTLTEGPNKTQTDPYTKADLSLYNDKTGKYSKVYSDKCVRKKVRKVYKNFTKEAYCVKKDTRYGRRDILRFNSKPKLSLCGEGCENGACKKKSTTEKAQILEIPLPENSHCFTGMSGLANFPECAKFFKIDSIGNKVRTCPKYYSPVYDENGTFYPSACWAEELGIRSYKYGYSPRLIQFIKDIWAVPSFKGLKSYKIGYPEIEFSYFIGDKHGDYFRSFIWLNKTKRENLDFDIFTYLITPNGEIINTNVIAPAPSGNLYYHDYKKEQETLISFVKFDDAYPDEMLINWTKEVNIKMNDYFSKKQNLKDKIKHKFYPVIISPPEGVLPTDENKQMFTDEELHKIYNASIDKLGKNKFDDFVVAPIVISGFGGGYTIWNNMDHIKAPLNPKTKYPGLNDIESINAVIAFFGDMAGTIHHELLHSYGLRGDHFPMNANIELLTPDGTLIDNITGREGKEKVSFCDYLGIQKEEYYSFKLPEDLKIYEGKEPGWATVIPSSTGNCIIPSDYSFTLKDFDSDGEYEVVYEFQKIDSALQRALGWVDIDGDNISELEDPNPYMGVEANKNFYCPLEIEIEIQNQVYRISSSCELLEGNSSCYCYNAKKIENITIIRKNFTAVEEIKINDCIFEKIRLEGGEEGLVPLSCKEFENDIVNMYKGLKYSWIKIKRDYGTILLVRNDQER